MEQKAYHLQTPEDALEALGSSPKGLDQKEVQRRLEQYGKKQADRGGKDPHLEAVSGTVEGSYDHHSHCGGSGLCFDPPV